MIKIIDNDFDRLLGKLGLWPGDIDANDAEALYRAILTSGCKSIVEFDAIGGKSSVIAASAAFKISSRIAIIPERHDDLYFVRAVRLFDLDKSANIVPGAAHLPSGQIELAIVRHGKAQPAIKASPVIKIIGIGAFPDSAKSEALSSRVSVLNEKVYFAEDEHVETQRVLSVVK